jgi:hypothetical protein
MSRPLYLFRRSVSSISPALYSLENRDLWVRIIGAPSENHVSSETAAFVHVTKEDGEPLTYKKLLEFIFTARKVVTL